MPEVQEVLGNLPVLLLVGLAVLVASHALAAAAPHGAGGALALALEDVADEAVLEESLPRRPRHPRQDEADREQVGQPEVVGGHGGVLLRLHLGLVHETAGRLT